MKFNASKETHLRFHHGEAEHTHGHTHDADDHAHSHDCTEACNACSDCDPRQETLALMDYMIRHNTAHAKELVELAGKVDALGDHAASEQILTAVSEFEKGNLRLATVLASLK